jgi:hypothetical protein
LRLLVGGEGDTLRAFNPIAHERPDTTRRPDDSPRAMADWHA